MNPTKQTPENKCQTTIHSVHFGKVRDSAQLTNGQRIIRTSDRISAFDMMMPFQVENKGKCLQEVSLSAFKETEHVLPNHIVGPLDDSTLLVKNLSILPIEFIVRRYLTGSLWRLYKEKGPDGVANQYGVEMQKGLSEHARLEAPLFTPTFKAEMGHDLPLHDSQFANVLETHLASSKAKNEINFTCESVSKLCTNLKTKILELFLVGEKAAQQRSLILVDTKYELGFTAEGTLTLADEVHTPDSSRFWTEEPGEGPVKHLSKEFLRDELMQADIIENDNLTENGAQILQSRSGDLAKSVSERYQELRGMFVLDSSNTQEHVEWPVAKQKFEASIEPANSVSKMLVVGNGGRDYALLQKFASLPSLKETWISPSSRAWQARQRPVKHLSSTDVVSLSKRASELAIDLVIAGPEGPIAEGLKQSFESQNIPCLAPGPLGSSLEVSKILCKKALVQAGVPTAESKEVRLEELLGQPTPPFLPCVVKFDGLAGGKGVYVIHKNEQWVQCLSELKTLAPKWLSSMSSIKVPSASLEAQTPMFLIEECIIGEEYSLCALCNGKDFRLLPVARDYKRRNNDQQGPNTGGMGTVAPVKIADELMSQFKDALAKLLASQVNQGEPYQGFIFLGFMVNENNQAQVLEVNSRLGDPESQVILPGLKDEFTLECVRTAQGKEFFWPERSGTELSHDELVRLFVVGASPEYPYSSAPNRMLKRLDERDGYETKNPNTSLIPSAIETDGSTSGGRAFGVLAEATTVKEARKIAYAEMDHFRLDGEKPHFRTDIALELE